MPSHGSLTCSSKVVGCTCGLPRPSSDTCELYHRGFAGGAAAELTAAYSARFGSLEPIWPGGS